MKITVYLGASEGNDPALKTAVQELGRWIGQSGNALVYGGSRSGLMGLLADSVLAAGGQVTGVEPRFFVEQELQHNGLTELIVTENMAQRKAKMIELGDAFVAFPGGTGTLEEIAEVMSMVSLRQLDAPCILYNLNGYYDSLKALLNEMICKGLSSAQRQAGIHFAADLAQIRDNMYELSKTGRWLGGTTPTGYASESLSSVTVDGKVKKACKLKPIPEEIQLVKTIFSVFMETGSLSKTDQYLLEHRCVTKRGKQFTRFAIRGILTNPVYMIADGTAYQYLKENNVDLFAERAEFDDEHGVMAYNRTLQRPGKANQIRPMEEWIVAVGKHPGIIAGSDWGRVQAMLDVKIGRASCRERV